MQLTCYGHSTFCIEADPANVLTDPLLSDDPSRRDGWIGGRAGEDSMQEGER